MNVPVEWEEYDVSGETHGSERLFNEAMESLRRNKVGLKGELRVQEQIAAAALARAQCPPLCLSLFPSQVSSTPPSTLLLTTRGM